MKVYLVCVLDDKHYRDPDFYFFKTAFEAHKWIIDSLVSITEESMEEVTSNLDYRNVDGSDDQIMRIDYSYGDGEFYVNTIHEIEIKDGDYLCIYGLLGEGVRYETAGALQSGKKVWMLARLEGRMITDEKIDPFLVFTNSHDGKGSVRVAITPVRVWCQNTLNLALKEAERQWVCKHTGRIDEKLVEAKYTLMNTEHYLEALETEFGKMKMKKLDVDKVHKFVKMLLPINEKDGDRKVANIQEMRNELMMRYLNAPDLQVLEPSAYRFVNAVSDFSTHRKPSRGSEYYQENMFMKVVDGDELIDKAYAICDAEV